MDVYAREISELVTECVLPLELFFGNRASRRSSPEESEFIRIENILQNNSRSMASSSADTLSSCDFQLRRSYLYLDLLSHPSENVR